MNKIKLSEIEFRFQINGEVGWLNIINYVYEAFVGLVFFILAILECFPWCYF